MFNAAQAVLDKTESLLVSKTYQNRLVKWGAKIVGSPFSFLFLGIDEQVRPIKCFFIVFFVPLIIGLPIMEYMHIKREMRQVYLFIVCLVAFIVTVFSLPSTFSFSGVNNKEINTVADFIEAEVIETVQDVELLEQNFEVVFNHVYSRVKFYKFVVGTLWGLYMYYFNVGVMLWIKEGMPSGKNELGDHIGILILTALVTLAAFGFISAYKRANERLIKTIQFACVQVKYDLAEK